MATEERETVSLIGSDKVEGTSVYGADETQIGSIERVMIDKRSGKVSYAVLSFGGFLGIGDDHYPLPWSRSNMTPTLVVPDRNHREAAPRCANTAEKILELGRSDRTRGVNEYYAVFIPSGRVVIGGQLSSLPSPTVARLCKRQRISTLALVAPIKTHLTLELANHIFHNACADPRCVGGVAVGPPDSIQRKLSLPSAVRDQEIST